MKEQIEFCVSSEREESGRKSIERLEATQVEQVIVERDPDESGSGDRNHWYVHLQGGGRRITISIWTPSDSIDAYAGVRVGK